MPAIKPTRNFNHATQKKAKKYLNVLQVIQRKDTTLQELQIMHGGSPASIRGILYEFMRWQLIIDIDPLPRKSIYRITRDKELVDKKLAELKATLAVELLPMKIYHREPKSRAKTVSVAEVLPLVFSHSELHMRLFPRVYKNFISS